jgi:hypothetical protein
MLITGVKKGLSVGSGREIVLLNFDCPAYTHVEQVRNFFEIARLEFTLC